MVYQVEKSMNDFGDKVTQSDKDAVNPKLDALKEALKGSDINAIKNAKDELQKAFYEVAQRVYQQTGGQPGAAGPDVQGEGTSSMGGNPDDNIVDADFKDAN